jgi:hypothetical protein
MKKINLYTLIGLMAILICISSCSKKDSGNLDEPVVTTPVQVEAEVSRSVLYDGTTNIEYYFTVRDNNVLVNSATITVNGINVPRVIGFIDGYYDLREYDNPAASYVPGQTYTASVQYNGKTYTESMKAPGGFALNSDYTKIQWDQNGNYATLDIYYLYGSTTYTVPSTRPSPLTSPQTIPSKAYPTPGSTYTIHGWVQNSKKKSFGSLSGDNSYMTVTDFKEWRVTK